jgi:transposase
MGEERRFAKDFCGITDARDHSGTHRSPRLGQHIMQGTPRRTRGFKKLGEQAIGKSRGGWNTKLHVVSADDKVIVEMRLSSGSCHDAPEGRISIAAIGEAFEDIPLLMDRAYEGDETRALAATNGHEPIVPPKKNRKDPWEYDKEKYKRRNVVERLFRRLKEFRKVCTRYDKTDIMFLAIIQFAFIAICLQ